MLFTDLGRRGFLGNYNSRLEVLNKIKEVNDKIQGEVDRKIVLMKSIEKKRALLFSALMDKVRLKIK
jgi:hypothetical protein